MPYNFVIYFTHCRVIKTEKLQAFELPPDLDTTYHRIHYSNQELAMAIYIKTVDQSV